MSLLIKLVQLALSEAEREGPWEESSLPEDPNLPFSKVVSDLEAAHMIEVKRAQGGIESAKLLHDGSKVLRALRAPQLAAQLESSSSVVELRDGAIRLLNS